MKRCNRCGEEKLESEFRGRKDRGGRLNTYCRRCLCDLAKVYRHRHGVRAWRAKRRAHYRENRQRILAYAASWRVRFKGEIFSPYGGCRCVCCGEIELKFLSIDNIEGGGAKDRGKARGGISGVNFYSKLKKRGFPPGYQVLCFNCNCAKGFYGICPHQETRSGPTAAHAASGT